MLKKAEKIRKVNTNISLIVDLKKQLQIFAIKNDSNLSEVLNEAGQAYLDSNVENVENT